MHSFRKGSDWARRMNIGIYRDFHRQVMNRVLSRPTATVLIAANPEEPAQIYGYMVVERGTARRPVVHYLYVKEPFRRLGVATNLIEESRVNPFRVFFTHLTKDRSDLNPKSPLYGKVRWRGAETLLRKYPEAQLTRDPKTNKPVFTDGNMWVPYLV